MDYKLMVKRRLYLINEIAWQEHNAVGYLLCYDLPFNRYYNHIVQDTYIRFVSIHCENLSYLSNRVNDEYGLYDIVKWYMDLNLKVKLNEKYIELVRGVTES